MINFGIEFDGYVTCLVVWDRFQKFLAKSRSRSVKEGQILPAPANVDKKGIMVDQFKAQRIFNMEICFCESYKNRIYLYLLNRAFDWQAVFFVG